MFDQWLVQGLIRPLGLSGISDLPTWLDSPWSNVSSWAYWSNNGHGLTIFIWVSTKFCSNKETGKIIGQLLLSGRRGKYHKIVRLTLRWLILRQLHPKQFQSVLKHESTLLFHGWNNPLEVWKALSRDEECA